MMIFVLDEQLNIFQILEKWSYFNIAENLNAVGNFEVLMEIDIKNTFLVKRLMENKNTYLMFDYGDDFFNNSKIQKQTQKILIGQIKDLKKDADTPYSGTYTAKGKLMSEKLTKRIMYGQQNYTQDLVGNLELLFRNNLINPQYEPEKRKLPLHTNLHDLSGVYPDKLNAQFTFKDVAYALQYFLNFYNLGYELIPDIQEDGTFTTKNFALNIIEGRDLTIKNTKNNTPILLSQNRNNLQRVTMEIDGSACSNMAFVAGEGEDLDRTVYNIETTQTGWNREETFIDARDLRKTKEDGTEISSADYNNLLKERGLSKLEETALKIMYESTVTPEEISKLYGRTIFLGDYVTIVDNDFPDLVLKAQITGAKTFITKGSVSVDLSFKYFDKGVI